MFSEVITQQVTDFYDMLTRELKSGDIKLPPFPEMAIRVRNVLEDETSEIDEIVKVIKLDPALSARVLQMANSANMSKGTDGPTIDLKSATSRVGLKSIRNAAMALAMQQIYQSSSTSKTTKQLLDSLWVHSVDVAAISYVLAKELSNINPDEALLAGLLHDVGKLLIINRAEFYPDLQSDVESLNKLLFKWGPQISSRVIKSWDLGSEFAKVAKDHCKLDRNPGDEGDLTDIVTLANLISQRSQVSYNNNQKCSQATALVRFKKTADDFMAMVDDIVFDANLLSSAMMD